MFFTSMILSEPVEVGHVAILLIPFRVIGDSPSQTTINDFEDDPIPDSKTNPVKVVGLNPSTVVKLYK